MNFLVHEARCENKPDGKRVNKSEYMEINFSGGSRGRSSRASPTSRWAGGREPSLYTVLFWPVTQYLMNIVIFKWVLANSDEYHLLKWVLITPLSNLVYAKFTRGRR